MTADQVPLKDKTIPNSCASNYLSSTYVNQKFGSSVTENRQDPKHKGKYGHNSATNETCYSFNENEEFHNHVTGFELFYFCKFWSAVADSLLNLFHFKNKINQNKFTVVHCTDVLEFI